MYELHVGSIHTLKLMLHPWKHAFMLYLYVSTQSILKQKLMPYSKILPMHDGRLLGLFLPQLRKFNFWLTEQYFICQMKQDIKTS